MVIRLDQEEATEVRAALEAARGAITAALGRFAGCGYSQEGIRLCETRQRLDHVIRRLSEPQREWEVIRSRVPQHTLQALESQPRSGEEHAA
jgi:hypothetical protein